MTEDELIAGYDAVPEEVMGLIIDATVLTLAESGNWEAVTAEALATVSLAAHLGMVKTSEDVLRATIQSVRASLTTHGARLLADAARAEMQRARLSIVRDAAEPEGEPDMAIVETILDLQPEADKDMPDWLHLDGTPMTPQERNLVCAATWAELSKVQEIMHARARRER